MKIDIDDAMLAAIADWNIDREQTLDASGLYCDEHLNELCDSVNEQADVILEQITALIQMAMDEVTVQ